MTRSRAAALALALVLPASAAAQNAERLRTEKAEVLVETVARGLEHPWGLAFLPDGRMLVTERPGRLRVVSAEGEVFELLDTLGLRVVSRGQCGLLDVEIDTGYAKNR